MIRRQDFFHYSGLLDFSGFWKFGEGCRRKRETLNPRYFTDKIETIQYTITNKNNKNNNKNDKNNKFNNMETESYFLNSLLLQVASLSVGSSCS
jgi:hypothetical protein